MDVGKNGNLEELKFEKKDTGRGAIIVDLQIINLYLLLIYNL